MMTPTTAPTCRAADVAASAAFAIQPGCTCTCCSRVRTAERAHVRDEEQQREREGGQHGREQSARRGAGEGALRRPDLGGGFEVLEAEEDGREAEEDGERGGGCHGGAVASWFLCFGFKGGGGEED